MYDTRVTRCVRVRTYGIVFAGDQNAALTYTYTRIHTRVRTHYSSRLATVYAKHYSGITLHPPPTSKSRERKTYQPPQDRLFTSGRWKMINRQFGQAAQRCIPPVN